MTVRFHAAPIAGAALTTLFLTLLNGAALAGGKCDCVCVPAKAVSHATRSAPARVVHHIKDADADYASSYYDYQSSSRVREVTVMQQPRPWVEAPHDGNVGCQERCDASGPQVLNRVDVDFHGGVGYDQANQGYMDGYGQVHFATAGNGQNGPTYNSYDQSFQTGGFADGGFGRERLGPWHGYNSYGGLSNGY